MNKLKLIGKGAFTKCYLMSNETTVLLRSSCPIKECMALGWFPDSELFPAIVKEDLEIYTMDYYPRVSSLKKNLKPEQYQLYKDLRALSCEILKSKYESFNAWHKAFDTLDNEELKEVMKEALDACGNYGTDISFEVSPRNVAVSKGNLVLLDCFFSLSKLEGIRKK